MYLDMRDGLCLIENCMYNDLNLLARNPPMRNSHITCSRAVTPFVTQRLHTIKGIQIHYYTESFI